MLFRRWKGPRRQRRRHAGVTVEKP